MLDLKEIRKINFQQLVSNLGGQTEVADKINRKKSQVNALCKGRAHIGENLARAIEQKLDLPELTLDQPPKYIEGKTRVLPVYGLSGCMKKTPENILSYIPYSQEEADLFAVALQSDILEPDYPKDTIFIIEETEKYSHGDMVLVVFDMNKKYTLPTFRYIYISEDKEVGLVTVNLSNKPEFLKNYKILGIVKTAIFNLEKRNFDF